MVYSEYEDLRLKAEKDGRYKIYLFDIENSSKMPSTERRLAQILSMQLLENVYKRIMCLEYQLNKPILHHNPIFNSDPLRKDMDEPFFIYGDSFGFTIIKDSIPDTAILNLVTIEKDNLDIDFNYHLTIGYYETDLYERGDREYFRGYCIESAIYDKSKRLTKI